MRKETIEVTYYQFDELDDAAKEVARTWWRDCENEDNSFKEHVYEEAARVGALIGIDIDNRQIPLMNGDTRPEPQIYYSGFSSQGDGACFEGSYSYKKGSVEAATKNLNDQTVINIAMELAATQKRYFYSLTANCRHSGHYYHSGCMKVNVFDRVGDDVAYDSDAQTHVETLLRDFADWIYQQLEEEYEHIMSDANVDDCIMCNEYEFDKEGKRLL